VYGVIILECIFVTSCVLFYCTVCTALIHTLVAVLLARSQQSHSTPQEPSSCFVLPIG